MASYSKFVVVKNNDTDNDVYHPGGDQSVEYYDDLDMAKENAVTNGEDYAVYQIVGITTPPKFRKVGR